MPSRVALHHSLGHQSFDPGAGPPALLVASQRFPNAGRGNPFDLGLFLQVTQYFLLVTGRFEIGSKFEQHERNLL